MSGLIRVAAADLPILYSFRRCPYAMRARMALAVSGIPVELREVVLRDKPPELLAASPKGTVPILVMPDGAVIDESIDIMRWALAQYDPEHWLTGNGDALITDNDGVFKYALDRYKYPHRHGVLDASIFRADGMTYLLSLEDKLQAGGFLCGVAATLADHAIFPFVRQYAATDRAWFDAQPVPHLRRWLDVLIASPLFETIMARPAI